VSRYREQVGAALDAVTIRGPTRYAWLGRPSRALPAAVHADLAGPERRSYLVSCLREELYCSFYCHGAPVPARWGEPEPAGADPWLVSELSRANSGRGGRDPHWTVERLDRDAAVVTAGRLRVRVPPWQCRASHGSVQPGASVSLPVPKELPALSYGYYTAVGDAPGELASPSGVVRVYWNIAPTGAPALVDELTRRLNRARVPFRLKVADHGFRLDRRDAAVLYLRADWFAALRGALRDVARALRARMHPGIPAFTLELVPGVGLAEETGGDKGFGERRCALLADGIVRAHEQGIADAGARVETVADRFAEAGVRIDAPYLEPSLDGRHVL
jgi:HopA1 effector protein family